MTGPRSAPRWYGVREYVSQVAALPGPATIGPSELQGLLCALCCADLAQMPSTRNVGALRVDIGMPRERVAELWAVHARLRHRRRRPPPGHIRQEDSVIQARWVIGQCWLYCQRPDAVVTWIGPVHHDGAHAPMYACDPCLRILAKHVHAHAETGDRTPVTVH